MRIIVHNYFPKQRTWDKGFKESEHPRGQPENAGQFAPAKGSVGKPSSLSSVWKAGAAHKQAGKSIAENPYALGSEEREAWRKGWRGLPNRYEQKPSSVEPKEPKPPSSKVVKPSLEVVVGAQRNALHKYAKATGWEFIDKQDLPGGWSRPRILERGSQLGLNKYETAAIYGYTGDAYEVNKDLRSGKPPPDAKAYAELLNQALDKLPLYSAPTTRTANLSQADISKYKKGIKFSEPAFLSTTKASSVKLAEGPEQGQSLVKFEIEGKNGRVVEELSSNAHEKEVLFKAGTNFEVLSNDGKVIKIREI